MTPHRSRLALALTPLLALTLACSSPDPAPVDTSTQESQGSPPSPPSPQSPGGQRSAAPSGSGETTGEEYLITSENFEFSENLTVPPGAKITYRNLDGAQHDVVADDGSFRTELLDQGEETSFTAPTKPGRYSFICSVHPYMKGTLIVA